MASFTVREDKLRKTLNRNPILVTALNRIIGYEKAAAIAIAAALIGFAQPVANLETRLAGGGPALLVLDQGWASAPDWTQRVATTRAILDEAAQADREVLLASIADGEISPPVSADAARPLPDLSFYSAKQELSWQHTDPLGQIDATGPILYFWLNHLEIPGTLLDKGTWPCAAKWTVRRH